MGVPNPPSPKTRNMSHWCPLACSALRESMDTQALNSRGARGEGGGRRREEGRTGYIQKEMNANVHGVIMKTGGLTGVVVGQFGCVSARFLPGAGVAVVVGAFSRPWIQSSGEVLGSAD